MKKKGEKKKAVFNDSVSTTMNFYVTIFHAGNNTVKKKVSFMHMHFLSPQSTSKKLHISTVTYNLLLTNCKAVMYKSI